MKLIEIRKALGMSQQEFGTLFDRSRNWSGRFDNYEVDECYDRLTGRQLETLDKLANQAEELTKVRREYGL